MNDASKFAVSAVLVGLVIVGWPFALIFAVAGYVLIGLVCAVASAWDWIEDCV